MSRALPGLFLCGLALTGCSLLYDLSPDQCESRSDCESFGTGFTCESGVCVCRGASCGTAGVSGQTSGGSSGDAGEGNTGGTGETGGVAGSESGGVAGMDVGGTSGTAGTGGTEPVPECDGHDDCLDTTNPKACVEGRCVELRTTECPVLLPRKGDLWEENLADPDAIILGAFGFLGGDNLQSYELRNFDLAVTELSERTGGYVSASGEKPVVMVVCSEQYQAETELDAAANHLINELKVPAVLSQLGSDDLQRTFAEYGRAQSVFFMSATPPDANLVNIEDDGLLWHALSGMEQLGLSYKPLLNRAIDLIQPTEPVRVALLTATGVRDLGELGQTVEDVIVFNGMSAAANGANYLSLSVVSALENRQASQVAVIQDLWDFAPHVVIAIGSIEFYENIVPLLEDGWASAVGSQAKPFYLLSPYQYNQTSAVNALLTSHPAVRSRMVGVNWPAAEDPSAYTRYMLRFDQANPEVRMEAGRYGYENYYDAAYYLLYAIAGSGVGTTPNLRGSAIATGMTRLLSGDEFEVGTADMPNAFARLRQRSTTITLMGTMGPPAFDETSGTRLDAGSVWCLNSAKAFVPDVLRYDATNESLVGTFPTDCFAGF